MCFCFIASSTRFQYYNPFLFFFFIFSPPMLGAQGLWTGRDLYRATPAVHMTRGLGFSGLTRRTAPFSRFLRHAKGYGGSFLTRILKGKIHDRWGISVDCWKTMVISIQVHNRDELLSPFESSCFSELRYIFAIGFQILVFMYINTISNDISNGL
jgi:hypothetical protein